MQHNTKVQSQWQNKHIHTNISSLFKQSQLQNQIVQSNISLYNFSVQSSDILAFTSINQITVLKIFNIMKHHMKANANVLHPNKPRKKKLNTDY